MALTSVAIYGNNREDRTKVSSLLDFFSLESVHGNPDSEPADRNQSATACICHSAKEFIQLHDQFSAAQKKVPLIVFTTDDTFRSEQTQSSLLSDAQIDVDKCFFLPLSCTHKTLKDTLERVTKVCSSVSRRRSQSLQSLEGTSPGIQAVKRLIEQVANTHANVLILGESGTGKELVARGIHRLSDRADKPFVPVNCGAIPKDLLESELFGHEKGAFTGAITARIGRFELAEGGTLFLDEIGDMDINMQVKILRVLQEKTFERVGSNRSIKADVRIVAATHRNLEQAIAAGDFREDLFYRLNVFPIEMPPLRERREDVPALAHSMIQRLAKEQGAYSLDQATLNALINHDWPGNVRELANLIERLRILYPDQTVRLEDLPASYSGNYQPEVTGMASATAQPVEMISSPSQHLAAGNFDLKEHLQNIEFDHIKEALKKSNGVVATAAKLLNLRRTTLVEKMRKYSIEREEAMS